MATLHLYAKAGSATEGLAIEGGRLTARVRARAVDGAANAAITALVARVLGVPRSAVSLAGGHHSKQKRFTVDGLSDDEVRERLQRS